MAADDPDDPTDETDETDETENVEPADLRAELDRQRDRATRPAAGGEEFVDLLSAAFDTDKRTRVYVALRHNPDSTVEELAGFTGLYPSAVDRVIADLREEGVVERRTTDDSNPTYTAVAPQEAVDAVLGRVQATIDDLFGLDRSRERTTDESTEPVTIPVEDASGDADDSNEERSH